MQRGRCAGATALGVGATATTVCTPTDCPRIRVRTGIIAPAQPVLQSAVGKGRRPRRAPRCSHRLRSWRNSGLSPPPVTRPAFVSARVSSADFRIARRMQRRHARANVDACSPKQKRPLGMRRTQGCPVDLFVSCRRAPPLEQGRVSAKKRGIGVACALKTDVAAGHGKGVRHARGNSELFRARCF